jgi:hypothetical protein
MSHAEIVGVDDEEAGARGIAEPFLNGDRRATHRRKPSERRHKNAKNEISGFGHTWMTR